VGKSIQGLNCLSWKETVDGQAVLKLILQSVLRLHVGNQKMRQRCQPQTLKARRLSQHDSYSHIGSPVSACTWCEAGTMT
jgi:hypothetical protein